MQNNGIRKYVSNPTIGLLPFVLYLILHVLQIEEQYAIIIPLILAIIGEISFRTYYKSKGFSVTFYITIISLIITLITWLISHEHVNKPNAYTIVCEVSIICLFIVLRASKVYIVSRFFRQKNMLQKALLNEFFGSATLLQYGLTLHVFGVMLYRQLSIHNTYSHTFDIIIFAIIPIFIIFSIGTYQILKVSALSEKLRKEEWLPIITEKGEVTGKIAKTVSINMKNKFLHPVVRIALISNSKVYLQDRELNDILNPGKLDYPFEKYMLFNHDINPAVQNCIKQKLKNNVEVSSKFVLKYVFENDNTKRLIFLFAAHIEDENKIKRTEFMKGKFWTINQIEDGFADDIFGECFELEFEYLKNMVLLRPEEFNEKK